MSYAWGRKIGSAGLLLLAFASEALAQYPPEIQWRTIHTAHFEVVFPSELEADGQRLANALETMYGPLTRSLGTGLPKHNTVLLANQRVTRTSGGFISMMPRMATMQSMPMQSFWGTNDWIDTLTVNESRRLVQIAKINHGFGKAAYTLFGEAGLLTLGLWSTPTWWLAGDARSAETSMLRGAQGQYSSSEMATRALLMSGDSFSFMKAMHGSLKDQMPSQAELGAFLVNHVERTAGAETWDQIMSRASLNSWNPFAVSMAMKKVTGFGAGANYQRTMSQIGETWKAAAEGAVYSEPQVVNTAPKRSYTSFVQPVFERDGSVVAQKSGFDTFPLAIVRVRPDGKEQTVAKIAPTVSGAGRTSIAGGKLVWDEYVPDVRWQRSYSEILIKDLATGKTRRLTHRTRFQNPVLSPDGARIAVVEFLPDRRCSLVILDAETGAEVQRLASPGNAMIYTPAWSEDGTRVVMVTQGGSGRALTVAELASGTFRNVIPPRDEELAHPVFFGKFVLYKSSREGVVNIFAARMANGQTYQVTWAKFGADYPSVSPDGTKLIYSDYTARGYNLAELPLDPKSWQAVDWMPGPTTVGLAKPLHDYSAEVPATQYAVANYRPAAHLFDVHSWGFKSGPPEIGVGLESNDKMGLLGFHATLLYNTDEMAPGFSTGVSYSRFFPVMYFDLTDRNRRLEYPGFTEHFTERTVTGGLYVPLNFSRGLYTTLVSIGTAVQHIELHGGSLLPLSYSAAAAHIRQSSPRDLAPAWSQAFRVVYSHQMAANPFTANHLATNGRFALPGLFQHHSLVLGAGYERNSGSYLFSRSVPFARGYTGYTGRNLEAFNSTYRAPLFYPDWSLGQLIYVKRVSGGLFYDYSKQDGRTYRSTGVELVLDVNVFHWPGVRVGLRESYRLDYGNRRLNPFVAFGW